MAEKNTRWENDKEWAGWTIRDELYGYIRAHLGPIVIAALVSIAGTVWAFVQSHAVLGYCLATAVLTITVLAVLARNDGRKRASRATPDIPPRTTESARRLPVEESPPSGFGGAFEKLEAALSRLGGDEPRSIEPAPKPTETPKPAPAQLPEPGAGTGAPSSTRPDPEKLAQAAKVHQSLGASRSFGDLSPDQWIKLGKLYIASATGYSQGSGETKRTWTEYCLQLMFPPDTTDRNSDALLLLIFGYRQIYGSSAKAADLDKGLARSGCLRTPPSSSALALIVYSADDFHLDVDELARGLHAYGLVSRKMELTKGGAYQLTDKGVEKALHLFEDLVSRA